MSRKSRTPRLESIKEEVKGLALIEYLVDSDPTNTLLDLVIAKLHTEVNEKQMKNIRI